MQDILGRQDNDGGLEIKDSWRMQVNEEPLELVTRKSEERGKRRTNLGHAQLGEKNGKAERCSLDV